MDGQTLVWFGISGGAALFAVSLLWQRFVRRTPQAMHAPGAFVMFSILMFLFALGALAAGLVSAGL